MATELQRSASVDRIAELLGPDASKLLDHTSQTISKDDIQLQDLTSSIAYRGESPIVHRRPPFTANAFR